MKKILRNGLAALALSLSLASASPQQACAATAVLRVSHTVGLKTSPVPASKKTYEIETDEYIIRVYTDQDGRTHIVIISKKSTIKE